MIDRIWFGLILIGTVWAVVSGNPQLILDTALRSAKSAVTYALELAGLMTFWLGILKIAEKSGIIAKTAAVARPLMGFLFPDVPRNHPAMGAMIMNISASVLGMGNAATPFGLSAMKSLQELNPEPDRASGAMCTFMAMNTASLTLIPATVISARSLAGSASPGAILPAAVLTGLTGSVTALALDRFFRKP
ncbi:MAG: spore maturation protein [Peptococcaceae bacterium]|jgi:spore maturation protein A|nr:spore maturation protein [Peptococcaceae bacterium]